MQEFTLLRTALLKVVLLSTVLTTGCTLQAEPVKNGFNLENSLVPPSEIKGGGPPKDGIPALTDPDMIPAEDAEFLDGSDQVIGVSINNEARAYPLKILVHHENVNDVVGDTPIAVTY